MRDRARTRKRRGGEGERKRGIVQATALVQRREKKCKIMQVTPRGKRKRSEKCLLRLVVVVLITTLKLGRARMRSRRVGLIFDTENVSSWSASLLPTSPVVDEQHE